MNIIFSVIAVALLLIILVWVIGKTHKNVKQEAIAEVASAVSTADIIHTAVFLYKGMPVWFTKKKEGGWTCFIVRTDDKGFPYRSYFHKEKVISFLETIKTTDPGIYLAVSAYYNNLNK